MSRFKLKKIKCSDAADEEPSERNELFGSCSKEDCSIPDSSSGECSSKVTSKYFENDVSKSPSEIDFKDDQKPKRVAKNLQNKPSKAKSKSNRNRKQADIRKVMSKDKTKNELEKFTRQFEEVCHQGGIDVNPEHLQMAIALSRSLSEETEPTTSKEESLYDFETDNVKKARKTLEQFGFKVKSGPIHLKSDQTTHQRKRKLKSVLINFCPETRKRIISEKLTSILNSCVKECDSKNAVSCLISDVLKDCYSESRLWDSCAFPILSDIGNPFYVNDLFEISNNKLGRMLKNWDDIPGREKSPDRLVVNQESKITIENCDIILGSTFANIKKMLYSEVPRSESDDCGDKNKNEAVEFQISSDECSLFEKSDCSDGILHFESFRDDNKFDTDNIPKSSQSLDCPIVIDDDSCEDKIIEEENPAEVHKTIEFSFDLPNQDHSEIIENPASYSQLGCNDEIFVLSDGEDQSEKSIIQDRSKLLQAKDEECTILIEDAPPTSDSQSCSLSQSYDEASYILSDDEINYSMAKTHVEVNTPSRQESDVASTSISSSKAEECTSKTGNVTPMPDFKSMSSPQIETRLENYGIKTLKRKRAIQLLEYIYDQTHPRIEDVPSESQQIKKHKSKSKSPSLIKKKTKTYSKVPLHVAFKDFLSKRPHIKEEIFNYTPLSLESIHKDLKFDGYKYNIKDLIQFLDQKCITFRTEKKNMKNN